MKKLNQYDDCDLVWACLRYSEGKHHIDTTFISGVWEYLVFKSIMTEKQRKAVVKFIKRERIDVEKWKSVD